MVASYKASLCIMLPPSDNLAISDIFHEVGSSVRVLYDLYDSVGDKKDLR